MTHGDSLAMTIEATQKSLEERLGEALRLHGDPERPRDHYAAIDTFNAATSRHLAAVEEVLVPRLRRTGPDGEQLGQEYLVAARRLEHTLALIKGRLYGEAHAVHLAWADLWAAARGQLEEHNRIERRVLESLLRRGHADGDPAEVDGLAQQLFEAETRGPTRPHPKTPHSGRAGRIARRLWAVADRAWDAAEGRVIPDPVRPAPHRHDSLLGQYLVADPRFDADATLIDHRGRHRET